MKLPYQLGLGSRGKPVHSSSRQETPYPTFISTIIRAWTAAARTTERRAPELAPAKSGAPGVRFEPRSPSPQGEEASPRIGQESLPPTSCLCDEAPETSSISQDPTPTPSPPVSEIPSDISSTISEGTASSEQPIDGTTASSQVEDIETISSQISSEATTITSSQDGFRTVTVTYTLSDPSATGGPRTSTSSQTPLPTSSGDPDANGAFDQMALTGDAAAALISGFLILLLFVIILAIWLFFRDRNRESIGSPSSNELTDIAPPTIHLDLPSAAVTPRPSHDVLGQPAMIVPGTGSWPLPENQIRIPIRPRPKRRTLSSELSPFGYTAPISESGTESRPLSISAAWLRPLTGRRNRNGNGSGTTTPSGLRTETPNPNV